MPSHLLFSRRHRKAATANEAHEQHRQSLPGVLPASHSQRLSRCRHMPEPTLQARLYPQTDPSYGHCSYLNTCHRTASCKYLHFELDTTSSAGLRLQAHGPTPYLRSRLDRGTRDRDSFILLARSRSMALTNGSARLRRPGPHRQPQIRQCKQKRSGLTAISRILTTRCWASSTSFSPIRHGTSTCRCPTAP